MARRFDATRQQSSLSIDRAADQPRKCLVPVRACAWLNLSVGTDAANSAFAAGEMDARRAGRRHGRALGGQGSAPDQRGARCGQARAGADCGSGKSPDFAARSADRGISALAHDPEKHVLDLIGDGNRFPAFAKPAAYSAEAAASAAKAGSAGGGGGGQKERKQKKKH